MFVILSGAAGSGKDTVKMELLKKLKNSTTIKAYTTRKPRDDTKDLNNYFFVTEEEFIDLIKQNKLYEHSINHGNYYGTSKHELDSKLKQQQVIIKDIDVNGTKDLINIFKGKIRVVSIFLKVDKEELYQRMINRGETEESAKLRLTRLEYEESLLLMYDYVVLNNDLNKTVKIIEKIIEEEYKLIKK